MNESQLATKLLELVKARLTVFRHVELYSHGVPDYSISDGDRTIWIEFKKCGERWFTDHQRRNLNKLKNSWGVIIHGPGDIQWIWGPAVPKERFVCDANHEQHNVRWKWVSEQERFYGEVVHRVSGNWEPANPKL